MKFDMVDIVTERNLIQKRFRPPIYRTPLNIGDQIDHGHQLKIVYKPLLHDNEILGECDRRFYRVFMN